MISYLYMLEKYSKDSDFSSTLFDFIIDNKDILNYDLLENQDFLESCSEGENSVCSEDKLNLIIHSDLFESLKFTSDMSVDSFKTKQTLIFMLLFLLPEKDIQSLNSNPYKDLKDSWFDFKNESESYIKEVKKLIENESVVFRQFTNALSVQGKAKYQLDQLSKINTKQGDDDLIDQVTMVDPDFDYYFSSSRVQKIIDEGIDSKASNSYENLSFLKSICLFWFKDFMKNRLNSRT